MYDGGREGGEEAKAKRQRWGKRGVRAGRLEWVILADLKAELLKFGLIPPNLLFCPRVPCNVSVCVCILGKIEACRNTSGAPLSIHSVTSKEIYTNCLHNCLPLLTSPCAFKTIKSHVLQYSSFSFPSGLDPIHLTLKHANVMQLVVLERKQLAYTSN